MTLIRKFVPVLDLAGVTALALAALALAVPYGLLDNIPEALALRGFGLMFELGLLALSSARVLQILMRLREAPDPRRLRAANAPAIGESRALGS